MPIDDTVKMSWRVTSVAASTGVIRLPPEEDGTGEVVAPGQLPGVALEAHLALLRGRRPGRRPRGRRCGDCSTMTMVVPRPFSRSTTPSSCWTTMGSEAEGELVDQSTSACAAGRGERQHLLLAAGQRAGEVVGALGERRERLVHPGDAAVVVGNGRAGDTKAAISRSPARSSGEHPLPPGGRRDAEGPGSLGARDG